MDTEEGVECGPEVVSEGEAVDAPTTVQPSNEFDFEVRVCTFRESQN